jgi:serum/glucocorticoid-regulated kinase 2
VSIVRKKDTGKIYAMKTLSKAKIKRDSKVENILNERAILERVSHPFIVQMRYAFQNVTSTYINVTHNRRIICFYYLSFVQEVNYSLDLTMFHKEE